MKNYVLLLVVVFFAVVAGAQEASILSLSGSVEIKKPDGVWQAARTGQNVSSESMIATGFASSAVLSVGGMDITLSPLTRMSIDNIAEEKDAVNTNLSLKTGRLRASSSSGARKPRRAIDFKISTPVATAAVRGTDFYISTNKLETLEGLVQLSKGKSIVYAPAGSKSWSAPETRPTEPIELVGEVISPEITAVEEEAAIPKATTAGSVRLIIK